jgi:hypothetical protein
MRVAGAPLTPVVGHHKSMGVSAEIRPRKGRSLGSAAQVREALFRFFPDLKFSHFANPATNAKELRSFVRDRLQFLMPFKLVGPKAPFMFQGIRDGDGWAMDITFDDAESIDIVYISFYGKFAIAEPSFDALLKAHRWKLKVY